MTSTFPYLTTLILLPAGAAVVVALIPSAQRRAVQVVGFVASLAVLGIASAATVAFNRRYGATSSSPAISGSLRSGSPGASGWTASRSSWC